MSEPTVIRVENVSKRFVIRKEKSLKERVVNFGRSQRHKDDFWALRDVSLAITAGSSVGLVGPNGSGKSTLLKMIGGILHPTSGGVRTRGRIAALLELGAGFHPDLTGRENVYLNAAILGLSTQETDRYLDAIVDFSGIEPFIDTQVKFYSSGMYVRLAFAVAVHVDPDVLLVDEVLAVGDEPFQRKCMDRIRNFQQEGRTIVLVSHGLDQVAELCDRAVVLEAGAVIADGAPQDALRVLRREFAQMRAEDIGREQKHHAADQRGSRARVLAVRTLADDRPVHSVRTGTPVRVQVEVEAPEVLTEWSLGLTVQSALGQAVHATSSRLMGVDLGSVEGRRSFDFDVPALHLGEGTYSLSASVTDGAGTEVHRLLDGAPLEVTADGRESGLVHLAPRLTVPGGV
ncbi:ABC transporter ATP-binding protein [Cellulomonas cellasea]|uniref:ABC-2 type transport system ATP-binding protein n=1 Tax=Cellulomonas cellasea TaxID=43670 RepID=A0A7W4UD14_9CELL|nr:ABC transporter ATP-binding protein [Cellulomonas cellasea]MBB2921273.1 ABC-2 type transport system ATP-binding protein [Cellulomonas cellasea]